MYSLTLYGGQNIFFPVKSQRFVNKAGSFFFGFMNAGWVLRYLYRLVVADFEYPAMMKCGKLYVAFPFGSKCASRRQLNVSHVLMASKNVIPGSWNRINVFFMVVASGCLTGICTRSSSFLMVFDSSGMVILCSRGGTEDALSTVSTDNLQAPCVRLEWILP